MRVNSQQKNRFKKKFVPKQDLIFIGEIFLLTKLLNLQHYYYYSAK